jgi:hypothetical protein
MDRRDEITAPGETGAKPDVARVERVYELIAANGVLAGVEHLLTFCHEDVELRAFAETSVRWKFHFRDSLVDDVAWEPRAGG